MTGGQGHGVWDETRAAQGRGSKRARSRPGRAGRPRDPATTDMMEGVRPMFCNDMPPARQEALMATRGRDGGLHIRAGILPAEASA